MQDDDRLLKEALQDLASTVGESEVRDPLKIQAQVRRRKQRRRLRSRADCSHCGRVGAGAYG
jgi:predicted Zn-ribbon and HTH transcriptional regulator